MPKSMFNLISLPTQNRSLNLILNQTLIQNPTMTLPMFNGWSAQIMEKMITTLFQDIKMPEMVSSTTDGLIHSVGLTVAMMMNMFFFNMQNLKAQQRSTSESSIKLLSPDSRMLVMASNITDGPIPSAGLTTVKMMKSSSFNRNKILKSEDAAIRQTKNKCN